MKNLQLYLSLFILFLTSCTSKDNNVKYSYDPGTIPFQPEWEVLAEDPFDLSQFLDQTAGEQGFISINNGHFSYPGGRPFRIWGVNLTGGACFPDKDNAEKVARLLASLGINTVRFHFLDSNWGPESSIFNQESDNTAAFDEAQIDRLDYFVAALKEKGIYSNFNLNVGRTFRKGDGVPYYNYLGMAKAVTLFDDHIIHLEKDYAEKLLTHVNPYTKNEYRKEPALAFLEIVNENSLVEAWFRGHLEGNHNNEETTTWMDIPEYYARVLTGKYNDWLKEVLSEEDIKKIRQECAVPKSSVIPRLKASEFAEASKLRFHTEARFIMEMEDRFYSGMYTFLKDSLKVKQLVAANSDHNHWKSGYPLLSSTSKLDFVDGHVYWQHPRYFQDEEGKNTFSIENTPMVLEPGKSTVAQLARSAVVGKPFTVSEINHPFPNEYACEMIPIIASFALLQDWDGLYFYTLEHGDPSTWDSKRPGYFDILHDPVKISNLAAAAFTFHRGDISPASTLISRSYASEELYESIRNNNDEMPFFTPGFSSLLSLQYRTRIESFDKEKTTYPAPGNSQQIQSETGELEWYAEAEQAMVKINSPRSQSLVGFKNLINQNATDNLEANIANPFASIYLTSMDVMEIAASKRLLLTLSSTSSLSASEWNDERNSLLEWGNKPFQVVPVQGSIQLNTLRKAKIVTLISLDASGREKERIPLTMHRGSVLIPLDIPATWYILELN